MKDNITDNVMAFNKAVFTCTISSNTGTDSRDCLASDIVAVMAQIAGSNVGDVMLFMCIAAYYSNEPQTVQTKQGIYISISRANYGN